jgi:hypothetical protein
MPIVALKPATRFAAGSPIPIRKVRILLEASAPVDVFFCRHEQAPKITSVQEAINAGIQVLPQQMNLNIEIPIPADWTSGWTIVVGNASKDVIAVYYQVFPVP